MFCLRSELMYSVSIFLFLFIFSEIVQIDQTMKYELYAVGHLIFLSFHFLLIFCPQATLSHRSDVYIAGFFPYGFGVENSDTGRNTHCS